MLKPIPAREARMRTQPSIMLGLVLVLASLAGVGTSIYLLFGEPLADVSYGTYKPNWEDIGEFYISYIENWSSF